MKKRGRGGEGFGDAREKSKNRLNKHCALPVGQGRRGGHLRFEKGPGIVRLRAVPLGRFN